MSLQIRADTRPLAASFFVQDVVADVTMVPMLQTPRTGGLRERQSVCRAYVRVAKAICMHACADVDTRMHAWLLQGAQCGRMLCRCCVSVAESDDVCEFFSKTLTHYTHHACNSFADTLHAACL